MVNRPESIKARIETEAESTIDLTSDEGILSSSRSLVHGIATHLQNPHGAGSFTPAIYGTAWLSMIVKETDGAKRLLFPRCFTYILEQQQVSGAWESYNSPIDGILNSLAALLSMVKYTKHNLCYPIKLVFIRSRIDRAKPAISSLLNGWDVSSTRHVGFEMLVPSLLEQLEREGFPFDFLQRETLNSLHRRKIAKFPAELLYGIKSTTLLHSLEALVGNIDFDRVRHHLTGGSMLGSPSSTAAYLMYSSEWDTQAEDYLSRVEDQKYMGGIPSAFPSSIFESSWALSTLLSNGFSLDIFPTEDRQAVFGFLLNSLEQQNGVVGFAPGFLPDADDTAVAIHALGKNGIHYNVENLFQEFNTTTHFRTYSHESSPSFSANCNVLIALANSRNVRNYTKEIVKATEFLISAAENAEVFDKWNVAPTYSSMLLVHALTAVLSQWDQAKIPQLSDEMVHFRIPALLCQTIIRLPKMQEVNGSWGNLHEYTAYALIAIAHCLKLPWHSTIRKYAEAALSNGRRYLQGLSDNEINTPSYLWIEKVSYGSPVLLKTYLLAAMRSPASQTKWSGTIHATFETSEAFLSHMVPFLRKTPLFMGESPTSVALSLIESSIYLKRLSGGAEGMKIFPARKSVSNKYKQIIPFTWVGCNHLHDHILTSRQMWNMMIISDLIYQADEYMESTVSHFSEQERAQLIIFISQQCGVSDEWLRSGGSPKRRNITSIGENGTLNDSSRCKEAEEILKNFVTYIIQQPILAGSTNNSQRYVAKELCGFLIAHIRHVGDNSRLAQEELGYSELRNGNGHVSNVRTFRDPKIGYFEWLHTIATDDTSCPFAFAFFIALVADKGKELMPSIMAKYVVQSLSLQLGRMCRMYNDYGSLKRDQEEINLNSLNFPEFVESGTCEATAEGGKVALMELADYERKLLQSSLEQLRTLVADKTWRMVKLFVDVTDLYGHIYILKDLTNRTK